MSKYFRAGLLVIFFCSILQGFAYAEELSWDFHVDTQGWLPGYGVSSFGVSGGELSIGTSAPQAYFMSPQINADADKLSILVINIKTTDLYGNLRVLFASPFDTQLSAAKSVIVPLASAGRYHTYYVNMKKNPNWELMVRTLVIMPMDVPGSAEVGYIKLAEPDPWNLFMAQWNDFFSLEGLKASTVNFIYGPRIGNTSVNLYIYLIIALIFAYLAVRKFIEIKWDLKAFKEAFPAIIKRTVLASFVVWMLLDLRIDLDYFRIASIDWATFGGKDLEGKRAAATLGDYYQYLKFCDKVLPPRSKIGFSSTDAYFFEKGQYYLYPHLRVDDPDYVLVYAEQMSPSPSYEVFAKLTENEYILKRVKR